MKYQDQLQSTFRFQQYLVNGEQVMFISNKTAILILGLLLVLSACGGGGGDEGGAGGAGGAGGGTGPADDPYEPNNNIAQAWRINEQTWFNGISNDMDVYEIFVDPGSQRVIVDLQFIHADGNLELTMTGQSGVSIADSWSFTDNEAIDFTVPSSGLYYLAVFRLSGSQVNSYSIWWDDIDLSGSTDDSMEPNNTRGTAYPTNERVIYSGIQLDDDWYEIIVSSGFERVLARLQFTHSQGDIDLQLVNSSGTVLAQSESITDDELIDFTVPVGGVYYLKVYFEDAGNPYSLTWDDL